MSKWQQSFNPNSAAHKLVREQEQNFKRDTAIVHFHLKYIDEGQNHEVLGFFEGEKRSVQLVREHRRTSKETPQFLIFTEYILKRLFSC
jgi:hypothetical protein